MDINQLPPELILCIGDTLRRAPLNALVQTSRRHATILSPLLYHKAFRRHYRPAVDHEPEPRARSIWVYSRGRSYVSQRRLWSCVPFWDSEYVMEYFCNRSLEWAETRFGGRERNGANWLHLLAAAGHEKLLKMFMEKGLDVNSRDWAENTVLHSAAAAGQTKTFDILIEAGADILAVNQSNQSVLVYALVRHKMGAWIKVIDAVRARGGDINSNSDHTGVPPIFLATRVREAQPVIKHFLDNGVDVFQVLPTSNDTLLHWAARFGHEDIGNFLVSQMRSRPEFISFLNVQHVAPLHLAIRHKSWSLAKTLISDGADLESQDEFNRSALDLAIIYRCFPLFQDILSRYAHPVKAATEFKKALTRSIKEKDSTAVLHIVSLQSLEKPCSLKFQLPTLHSLIETHRNSISGCEIIEIIGDANADFHLLSKPSGETPLHAAIRKPIESSVCRDRLITYLLHKTHDFSLLTREGNSILHHAARYGSPKIVELVLKHPGTTPELFALENNAGKTALQEAAQRNGNHKQTVKLLMQARKDFDHRSIREKIISRSPRKIGKPAVPDPPIRGESEMEENPEIFKNKSTNMKMSNGSIGLGSPMGKSRERRITERGNFSIGENHEDVPSEAFQDVDFEDTE
ncbi:3028f823-31c2-47a0-8f04-fdab3387405f [Sclerotinia trifoliorum]|uniref:3028f823-31c2-47a0-8f04-fdab3387405f n=1 Tax=Sclerotinia trifoliorum TaxID=28548 RepID=A0A8H2ZNZ5_9HELO|nr:3028f823-31c2-47a0-8f04-fdab3387405f [Sclerotinia trifoliorum]